MNKIFCPNCGHEIEPGTQFCGNCGYNVAEYLEKQGADQQSVEKQADSRQQNTESKRQTPKSPKPPMSLKAKVGWIVGLVVLVLVVGAYMIGKSYYSADKQLERMITAISSDGDLTKYVMTDDPSLKVDTKELQPTQKYFKTHRSQLSALKSGLKSDGSYQDFQIEQDGRYLLLFPKYKLKIDPQYIRLETNHDNVAFYQGKKKIFTSTANKHSYKAGPYFPGTYSFNSRGTVGGHHMKNAKMVDLKGGSAGNLNLRLKTLSFTVKGFPGSIIYLNDKKLGKIDQTGKYRVKDQPASGDMLVYLDYMVKNKTVSSKKVNVQKKLANAQYYSTSSTIAPKFTGVISKSKAQDLFQTAFTEAQDQSDDAADSFRDGQNNKDFKDLYTMSKAFEDRDELYSFDYEVDVKSVAPAENGKSSVNFNVKFDFDKEDGRKVQVFAYPGVVSKDGDEYVIDQLGKNTKVSEKEY